MISSWWTRSIQSWGRGILFFKFHLVTFSWARKIPSSLWQETYPTLNKESKQTEVSIASSTPMQWRCANGMKKRQRKTACFQVRLCYSYAPGFRSTGRPMQKWNEIQPILKKFKQFSSFAQNFILEESLWCYVMGEAWLFPWLSLGIVIGCFTAEFTWPSK